MATARAFGIDLSGHRARQVDPGHCRRARLLFAMDAGHHRHLHRLAPALGDRIEPFLPWLGLPGVDVPDPYYAGPPMFDEVLGMIESASRALFRQLEPAIRPPS